MPRVRLLDERGRLPALRRGDGRLTRNTPTSGAVYPGRPAGEEKEMGCDIHVYPERLYKGKWIYRKVQGELEPRSYKLFGILAGVRDEEQVPIVPPRGLPDDMSETTAIEAKIWERDGHTPSWLTLPELLNFDWKAAGLWNEVQDLIYGLRELDETEGGNYSSIRIVFWFDN